MSSAEYELRSDDMPLLKLNKFVFELKSRSVLPKHKFFKLITTDASRVL